MTLIDEEKIINGFVHQILENDPEYSLMSDVEKEKIFGIYNLLITALHRALAYENVYPVVYANDAASKDVVERAIQNVETLIPEISRIKVSLIH